MKACSTWREFNCGPLPRQAAQSGRTSSLFRQLLEHLRDGVVESFLGDFVAVIL